MKWKHPARLFIVAPDRLNIEWLRTLRGHGLVFSVPWHLACGEQTSFSRSLFFSLPSRQVDLQQTRQTQSFAVRIDSRCFFSFVCVFLSLPRWDDNVGLEFIFVSYNYIESQTMKVGFNDKPRLLSRFYSLDWSCLMLKELMISSIDLDWYNKPNYDRSLMNSIIRGPCGESLFLIACTICAYWKSTKRVLIV